MTDIEVSTELLSGLVVLFRKPRGVLVHPGRHCVVVVSRRRHHREIAVFLVSAFRFDCSSHELLGRQVTWTRQIIAKLLTGKITFTPMIDKRSGAPSFKVQIPLTLQPLFEGVICPKGLASPTGFDPVSWP